MKLKDLITDSNRELYNRISVRLPVQLKKFNDDFWASDVEEKRIIVGYSPTRYPESSFVHEMLHVDTILKGYKRLRSGLSLNNAVLTQLPFLCPMIDNEFQHHKMYPEFCKLGYPSNQFYSDTDVITEQYILDGIETKGQSLTSIISIYFTLIAPGRSILPERLEALKEKFRNYDEGAFRDRFNAIDSIMQTWAADPTYHAEPYIIELLNLLGCGDAWVSYVHNADDFPDQGFFTSRAFTISDINQAFAS